MDLSFPRPRTSCIPICDTPEQILRPGDRRSLMKRALTGIVPRNILERKRKAFVERDPALNSRSVASKLLVSDRQHVSRASRIVSASRLTAELQSIQSGNPVPCILLSAYWH